MKRALSSGRIGPAFKCGVHSIVAYGLMFRLEAPDVMQVTRVADRTLADTYVLRNGLTYVCHWSESDGFVEYHEDGSQSDRTLQFTNHLPMNTVFNPETIIDTLRKLDGVVY